jgi:hypothetical protein
VNANLQQKVSNFFIAPFGVVTWAVNELDRMFRLEDPR